METVVFQPKFIDLNDFLTKQSIEIHFNYHHMQYYRNLLNLVPEITNLKKILHNYKQEKIQNNALQILNHNLFWMSLSLDQSDKQIKDLLEKIDFYTRFREAANSVFGSGWAWLTYSHMGFEIFCTSNAITTNKQPLVVLDLWEHAYYFCYQWNRKQYIEEFFKVINLQFIRSQLEIMNFDINKYLN